jgi:ATP-dependent RNA helicase RhlE
LLEDKEEFSKVLIFVGSKADADRLYETLNFEDESSVIHAGKEQNHRTKSIEKFANGTSRILIATDVVSRGIDIEKISTVISFDTPFYPENYIHRIGRTGRAEQKGRSILLCSEKEIALRDAIESLMKYSIPVNEFPEEVEITSRLTPEEEYKPTNEPELSEKNTSIKVGASFHEKKAKNKKVNAERKSYNKILKEKFKKPLRRGDKIQNMKKKNKKR